MMGQSKRERQSGKNNPVQHSKTNADDRSAEGLEVIDGERPLPILVVETLELSALHILESTKMLHSMRVSLVWNLHIAKSSNVVVGLRDCRRE